MAELLDQKCIPCSLGDLPLTQDQIDYYMKEVEGWSLVEGKITKTFKFKDFKEALDFTNKVGELAEKEGHHPVIHLSWGRVVIDLWTNKIKGLHDNDFILAAKIDELV